MNNSLENNINERNYLTINEAVKVLWHWRKYRNEVMYNSVYRYGIASVALTIAPYLLPDLIKKLGIAVLVFPVLASFLSVFAAYLVAVQYKLYKQVDNKYRSLLGKYNPEDMPKDKLIYRIIRQSMGKVLSAVFLCFGIIVELLNGLVLFYLVHHIIP